MQSAQLNLARKWRSKSFDTIIGQHLSIRMLKNSLYLGQYFPVYLFAGQRGCGKTTTARVFAAAINCEQLPIFQKSPQRAVVPCQECQSCQAMATGKHPDFLEMDAASHTGVDNVRQIIEASSLSPLMGRKKVYLIDEAHMLSKAAFNAFLKLLEEPPASVLFILATTDPQKIIETVRSRCFQLVFRPVGHDDVVAHLKAICADENIAADDDALALLAHESEGSVRDAINLLEQVRFSTRRVTQEAVLRVLGHISDEQLVVLLKHVISGSPEAVLTHLHEIGFNQYSPQAVWRKLVEALRVGIWLKYRVSSDSALETYAPFVQLVEEVSLQRLVRMLEHLCAAEQTLGRTTNKHLYLEMVLLQLCGHRKLGPDGSGGASAAPALTPVEVVSIDEDSDEDVDDDDEEDDEYEEDAKALTPDMRWQSFVSQLGSTDDPLVKSIFSQAQFQGYDQETGVVSIAFDAKFNFFAGCLQDSTNTWLPFLQGVFGNAVQCIPQFIPGLTQDITPAKKDNQEVASTSVAASSAVSSPGRIDVSDPEKWPKTHLVKKYFAGTVSVVAKG